MKPHRENINCDLLIIGTGMAGMSAGLFAVKEGIDAVQVGLTGEIGFASGLLDLLGVHPVEEGTLLDDPWQGIDRLVRDEPSHPYALMKLAEIRDAVQTVLDFLQESQYPHVASGERNQVVMTPVGTTKHTYAVPHTMYKGAQALAEGSECLLADFDGLKGYSARQMAESMGGLWPGLRPVRIAFPNSSGELYTEHMARALDTGQVREQLVDALRPHLGSAKVVGLPAVLGMYRTVQVMDDLQRAMGVPVFEVPTMLPGVAGLRLREIFEQRLPALGIRSLYQQRVLGAKRLSGGQWHLEIGSADVAVEVVARNVILCSGRFFGKGLKADRHGIRETIFDLPVVQPEERAAWHHKDLLHPQGHPINRAGVAVDPLFRPADGNGRPVYPNLFAAGSILAHQDWIRQKSGSGLAIATAAAAVRACKHQIK